MNYWLQDSSMAKQDTTTCLSLNGGVMTTWCPSLVHLYRSTAKLISNLQGAAGASLMLRQMEILETHRESHD